MIEPKITSTYEHNLQAVYYEINNRGICVSAPKLKEAKAFVRAELARNIAIASNQWNIKLFLGAHNDPNLGRKKDDPQRIDSYNLNSSSGERSFIKLLQRIGYTVPKISRRTAEGSYDSVYSANELALQRILRDNQFNYPSGDPAIKATLAIRELSKLDNSYLRSYLYKARDGQLYYLSNYNVAGTLTGRRASRIHSFGFGNNSQNFPKHSNIAKKFRECLIARPGNIFLMVDQKSAEEWPVSALAENYTALTEMINGVNRHIRRASYIFSIPEFSRSEAQWKDSIEYYLGKKTGHANNYGMQKQRMADSLIQEGHWFAVDYCGQCLNRLNQLEPNTKLVFHKYVEDTLYDCRKLVTPFGRERQFLGLRPNESNVKVFNEAYAWIPQSVVGDNTGFCVAETSDNKGACFIVQEGHDSIVNDILDTPDSMWQCLSTTIAGFSRKIRFHNGIEVEIPIEAELGYDMATTIKVKDLSYEGLKEARQKLIDLVGSRNVTTSTLPVLDNVLL
jgi:hypothetical protein